MKQGGIIVVALRLALVASLLPLQACAYWGGPLAGQVLEEGTTKPIPGAIVVVRWQGTALSFVDTHTVCMHVETATTDDQGRYHVPSWRKSAEPAGVRNLEPDIVAYKAGYEWSSVFAKKERIEYLKPFDRGSGERLEYLGRVISATSCGNAGESYKNLYRLRHAIYREAEAIAQTVDEKERAQRFKRLAEDTLVNRTKPTKYDELGRLINVDPRDKFSAEELK